MLICHLLQKLCQEIDVLVESNSNQPRVPLTKQIELTVWTLANHDVYRQIGNLSDMSRGNAHYCIHQILKVIAKRMKDSYIKWPSDDTYCRIASEFQSQYGFPGVIGCIDGMHVAVKVPRADRDSYINRKGFPSINVLAVCDHKMTFTYVYSDRAGSVHDARVLRVSSLGQKLTNGELLSNSNYHLLGDSAYPLIENLLVPYRDNGHLTPVQSKYNAVHSSTRCMIERSFGRLKGKFRRLKSIDATNLKNALLIIDSAFVLHNFILQYEDSDDDDYSDGESAVENVADVGSGRSSRSRKDAQHKRDHIASTL